MIVDFLREKETTRIDRHEELTKKGDTTLEALKKSDGSDETIAMDVPIDEDYEQELADACDNIYGSEFDREMVRKARALEMEGTGRCTCTRKDPSRSASSRPRSRPSR